MVKGVVVGTVGLAVLFGSPGISFARAKKPKVKMGCKCSCQYIDSKGDAHISGDVWLDDGNDGKNCQFFASRTWNCYNPEAGFVNGHLAYCHSAPQTAGKVSGSGAVQRPQDGVIGPVTPSQPRVAPSQAPGGSIQK
jgi:hypothetical protein